MSDRTPGSPARGCVIIPAHDEVAVIGRTLAPLAASAASGELLVIVACNGCRDETAAVAARHPGVRVLEVAAASKIAALNAADDLADELADELADRAAWPRLYLDADIEITRETVLAVLGRLTGGEPLAARPARVYRTDGVSAPVRAYYRARQRIARLDEHLWGAGAYAVSAAGHARFGRFPDVVADDFWIDRQFGPEEIAIVRDAPPVGVRPPRTTRALLRTLTRVYRGNGAVAVGSGAAEAPSTTIGPAEVLRTARGPRSALDAAVYLAFAIGGRLAGRRAAYLASRGGADRWARDDTTRRPATTTPASS